ncbi:unnamed protein product, partial [Enterobius vermicularis]|uniref:PhoLip_ATPase_C domain-containing protein n=1 Tax=Enterobius vermicularis TaxID=51028 RepID=A0A0N4UUB6_ENTVE
NVCFYLIGFWFSFFSAFSGQTIFEPWTITIFNILTTLPPVAIGLFDKSVPEKKLLENAAWYSSLQQSSFTNTGFGKWVALGILHSLILYFFSYFFLVKPVVWSNGRTDGRLMLAILCYTVSTSKSLNSIRLLNLASKITLTYLHYN